MFKWIGKRITQGALKQAGSTAKDEAFKISGYIVDIIKAPPEMALRMWEGVSPEDKELLKQAAISAARMTARAVITADKGGKVQF